MPIFEFGYRPWNGPLLAPWLRFWPITRAAMAVPLRSKTLQRSLFVAWMPLVYFAGAFFAVGSITESGPASGEFIRDFIRSSLGAELANRLRENPEQIRPLAWNTLFFHFLGTTQSIGMLVVVAIVGPPLIAQDVRSKAFLMYFSKPITVWGYLLGKAAVLLGFIVFITLLPALALYAVSIAFAPSLGALLDTWTTAVKILAAAGVIAIPSTLIMLYMSSMTREPRYAQFAWIAFILLGEAFFRTLQAMPGTRELNITMFLSLRQMSVVAIDAIFDPATTTFQLGAPTQAQHYWAFGGLLAISVFCLFAVRRRVTAPLRI